jgi:uncharacterized protein (DUF433 family)
MKLDRIQIDPERMNGQPCNRDLRLTVRRVLELVALYPDRDELQQEFPELDNEDIRQALLYAAFSLDDRVIELLPPAISISNSSSDIFRASAAVMFPLGSASIS